MIKHSPTTQRRKKSNLIGSARRRTSTTTEESQISPLGFVLRMSGNAAASHPESEQVPQEEGQQGEKSTNDEAVKRRKEADTTTLLRVSTVAENDGKRGTINVTEDQAARSDDCSDLTDNNNESDDQVVKTFPQKVS